MAATDSRSRPRIGRLLTWDALVRRRDQAKEGVDGLTVLEGVPGVGKTTFLRALARDSRRAGFHVFLAEAPAVENPPPFQLIREALSTPQEDAVGAPVTPPASLMALLPAQVLSGSTETSEREVRAPPEGTISEMETDRHRLSASLAQPLLSLAATAPVLLALDGLHQADEASLDFLEYFLDRISGRPIWVVATLDSGTSLLPDGLQRLLRRPATKRISLPALTDPELEEFLGWLEPQRRFAEAEIHRLYSMTGGVPVFVERLVHHPPLPSTAKPEAAEEPGVGDLPLGELDPETRQLLNLASAVGDEFSAQLLVAASGLEEEETLERIERLIELEILRELEWNRLAFARKGLRYRIYAGLTGTTVRLLHQRIAAALEKQGTSDPSTVYALARHTYLGRLDESAIRYNRQAAEFSGSSFQPRAAIGYLEHALEALQHSRPDDSETERKIRLELALQRTRAGELSKAEKTLRELEANRRLWEHADRTDRALLAVYLGRVLAEQGRWDEAERSLQEISAEPTTEGSTTPQRAALRLRGEVLFYRGDYAGALAAHEKAIRLATDAGDAREAAADSIRRSTALSMIPGHEAEARAGFEKAVDQLVGMGDASEAAFGLLALGADLLYHDQLADARAALSRAIELGSAAHDLRRLGWAYLVLADLEFESQNLPEAEGYNRQALAIFEQIDDALGQARTLLTEGRLALKREKFSAAQKVFEEARAIFVKYSLEADELEVELREAEVEIGKGQRDAAQQRLDRLTEKPLERLRPDLVADFRRLRERVASA